MHFWIIQYSSQMSARLLSPTRLRSARRSCFLQSREGSSNKHFRITGPTATRKSLASSTTTARKPMTSWKRASSTILTSSMPPPSVSFTRFAFTEMMNSEWCRRIQAVSKPCQMIGLNCSQVIKKKSPIAFLFSVSLRRNSWVINSHFSSKCLTDETGLVRSVTATPWMAQWQTQSGWSASRWSER